MFVCCRVSTQLQDTWVEARVCTIVYWTQAGMLVEIIQAGWIVTAVRHHVDKPQVMIDQLFFCHLVAFLCWAMVASRLIFFKKNGGLWGDQCTNLPAIKL